MERYFYVKQKSQPDIKEYLEQLKEKIKFIENSCDNKNLIIENCENKSLGYSSVLTTLDEINFSTISFREQLSNSNLNQIKSLETSQVGQLLMENQFDNENQFHDLLLKSKSQIQEKNEIDLGKLFLNQTENIHNVQNIKKEEESIFYSDSDNSENSDQQQQSLLLEELKDLSPINSEVSLHSKKPRKLKEPKKLKVKSIGKSLGKQRGPYRKYTFQQKSVIIDKINKSDSIQKIAQEYKIDAKTLKRWAEVGAKRKPGGGRKVQDEVMETKLLQTLKQMMMKTKQKVPKCIIKKKAKELSKFSNFKASKGWFNNFTVRYNFHDLEESIIEKE